MNIPELLSVVVVGYGACIAFILLSFIYALFFKRKGNRETWGKSEWVATLFLFLICPPIGTATLSRWVCKENVWLEK